MDRHIHQKSTKLSINYGSFKSLNRSLSTFLVSFLLFFCLFSIVGSSKIRTKNAFSPLDNSENTASPTDTPTTSSPQTPKINVKIYYESMNPYVRRFILEQLSPTIEYLNDHINITFVPYGTTKFENNKYKCPNGGENQCLANKYQACVISQIKEQKSRGEFVWCFFKNRKSYDIVNLAENCAPSFDDVWFNIEECMKEDNITDLMAKQTDPVKDKIKVDCPIHVEINQESLGDMENVIQNDGKHLISEICSKLDPTTKPDICNNITPVKRQKLSIYYESMDQVMGNYFQQQLNPLFHVLEDIIELEFIPFGRMVFDGKWNCSKGEQQCFSNQFQALVFDKYVNNMTQIGIIDPTNRAMHFLRCLYKQKSGNQFAQLEKCSNNHLSASDYIDFNLKIKMESDDLKKIIKKLETKTKKVLNDLKDAKFPVITINDKINQTDITMNLNNLIDQICSNHVSKIKPKICTKINVTVLYEAQHHQSRTFFLEQLRPLFMNMYNLINFDFKPAGRTKFIPGNPVHRSGKLECPGGPDQCELMKYHACVLNDFWKDGSAFIDHNRQFVFDFIQCTFKNIHFIDDVTVLVHQCFQKSFIEADFKKFWESLQACHEERSTQLLKNIIDETHSLVPNLAENKTIPIVILNAGCEHGTEKPLDDIKEIRLAICANYDEFHQPDFCQEDAPPKIELGIYYDSDNEIAKHFFVTQLSQWYRFMEEMADIQLVPVGNSESMIKEDGTCKNNNDVCYPNSIHAYVIDKYENHDEYDSIDGRLRTIQFVSCFFSYPEWHTNPKKSLEDCTEKHLIHSNWTQIVQAIEDQTAANSLLQAMKKTKDLKEKINKDTISIPWITMDQRHSHKQAIDDLFKFVCQKYQGDKPLECTMVEVEIYYSPLDAKTRKFFIEDVLPTFRNIRERIKLNLIPYGPNVDENSNVTEDCEKNSYLCDVNKIHACAIGKFWNNEALMEDDNTIYWDPTNQTLLFLNCFFKYIDYEDGWMGLMTKCANDYLPISFDSLFSCVKNDSESMMYMNKMRQLTIDLPTGKMTETPWVIVNGEQTCPCAERDLQSFICDQLIGEKPEVCLTKKASKVKMQFHYSAGCSDVSKYVREEMYPNYRELEEIMDIQLIPFGKATIQESDDSKPKLNCIGEKDCLGTRIHACVVNLFGTGNDDKNHIDGPLQVIKFLNCYFSDENYPQNPEDAGNKCVERIFFDGWNKVKMCAEKEGVELMKKFRDEYVNKLNDSLTYIPWVVINGKHSESAEKHLVKTVCDAYDGTEKPPICYETPDNNIDDNNVGKKEKMPVWQIVLIVIACLIVFVGVVYCCKRNKN